MFMLARLKLYAYAAVAVLGAMLMVYLKGAANGAKKYAQKLLKDVLMIC